VPEARFATTRLVELAAAHARLEDVQLGFAHGAFEPEQQAIIEACRIIDAVLIEDEGGGERTQFDEPVPVGRVARQAGDFEPHDDARFAERHFAHQLLETVARGGA
jgi:hypothetical protein